MPSPDVVTQPSIFIRVLSDFRDFPKIAKVAKGCKRGILWIPLDAKKILEVRFCFSISELDDTCVAYGAIAVS